MNQIEQIMNAVKEMIPGFEARAEQKEMIDTVYQSMVNGLKTAVHAPTGTGKSLGYLIPFLAAKLDNPKFKMTVSTYTIHLQEQLIRDIKILSSLYQSLRKEAGKSSAPLRYAALKGRSNYFCHYRFLQSERAGDIPPTTSRAIRTKLAEMIEGKQPQDRQHLDIPMNQQQWDQIRVYECLEKECPFYRDCTYFDHYFSGSYDISVVNHSLFMARFLFVTDAWKDIDFYIFDESHKLEKVIFHKFKNGQFHFYGGHRWR